MTSQFFANVYLNELDYFIKHKLKAKHYLRYVDDFVILSDSRKQLKELKPQINQFLKNYLKLELHPDKTKILKLSQGINFLGYRIFNHHKLLRKRNIKLLHKKLNSLTKDYNQGLIEFSKIHYFLNGWLEYARWADTYRLRKKILKFVMGSENPSF